MIITKKYYGCDTKPDYYIIKCNYNFDLREWTLDDYIFLISYDRYIYLSSNCLAYEHLNFSKIEKNMSHLLLFRLCKYGKTHSTATTKTT